MDKYLEIEPYVGVGLIKFGMSRDEVRKIINSNYEEFYKTKSSINTTDAFDDCGIHVQYDEKNNCVSIEMWLPSSPLLKGNKLLGIPYRKIKKLFLKLDDNLEFDEYGFTTHKYGIGIYVADPDSEPDEPVENIIIFSKSYYQNGSCS